MVMDDLMYLRKQQILTALALILLTPAVHSQISGIYTSFDGHYTSSRVQQKVITEDGVATIEEDFDTTITGLAEGITAGYRHVLKNKALLGISFTALNSHATPTEKAADHGLDRNKSALSFKNAAYPMASIGFFASQDTLIGIKAGYMLETWDMTYKNEHTAFKTDQHYKIKGGMLGGEITTMIRDKLLLSLSTSLSFPDKAVGSTRTTTNNYSLYISPKTAVTTVSLQYAPKAYSLIH